MEETRFDYKKLQTFTATVLEAIGHSPEDALLASNVLITADLRGVDSHGVARLRGYINLWKAQRMNPKPHIRIEHETPSTATIDGDQGLGLVVAPKAMNIAIEKARNVGTGWVAINNSNHFGIAGYHAMMALEHDMIGFAFTNATPTTAPTFSKQRMLGTNPIAVAFPTATQAPFIADFSTTTAAVGKLEILQRKNLQTPTGWIQDKDGNETQDAYGLKHGGALLPLGSDREHSSHKGYCLGAIVDIMSAVLSGANYGPWVPPFLAFMEPSQNQVGKGIGHFVGAMRIDAFRPADEFKKHMDNWITTFRNCTPVSQSEPVQIPGDYERECTENRKKEGIPLLPIVIQDLQEIGKMFSVEF
ncbi:MAG: Ldh family oxidoreductase [Bacteroidales bacterium]|nr:Ldh family oxidoreductase [Bacteroidales bacterium]NLK82335.1 Ldh family oxidoreductase [Bacteroidales bacterium]HPY82454.1 Ldh family oxidoreductase [Bacteroidales bacterium]